ncbi:MAG: glycerate kinase [Candidatus Glassbacteria bacterium]
MKIVLAPDSFKGTWSAPQAAVAFARGVREAYPRAETVELPLADGGEGTLEVVCRVAGGRIVTAAAVDPLGRPIEAGFGLLADGEAVVESARAIGLPLLAVNERNPWLVGTFGLGLVLGAALDKGARGLALTLGGSATVDGGVGMARALGWRFLDRAGKEIAEEGGRMLSHIARIDPKGSDPRLAGTRVRALCDVTNPLLGERGAARVFGPQKGADPEMVENLEAGLANLAVRMKADLGVDVTGLAGGGAAGGLGAAVAGFLGGRLVSGIDYVLDVTGFDREVAEADLVITGEGSFDSQSLGGKAVSGVLARSARAGVPVAVVCGRRAEGGPAGLPVFSAADLPGEGKGGLVDLEGLRRLAALAARAVLGG